MLHVMFVCVWLMTNLLKFFKVQKYYIKMLHELYKYEETYKFIFSKNKREFSKCYTFVCIVYEKLFKCF